MNYDKSLQIYFFSVNSHANKKYPSKIMTAYFAKYQTDLANTAGLVG